MGSIREVFRFFCFPEVKIARPREGLGVGARRRRAPTPSQAITRQRGGFGRASPSRSRKSLSYPGRVRPGRTGER